MPDVSKPALFACASCGPFAKALLGVFVSALLASNAAAQCRIEGTVRGLDGAPIAGALVRVQGPGLPSPLTATSSADGRYVVDNVKPGQWVKIVAYRNGLTVSQGFTLVTLFVEQVDLTAQPESPVAMGSAELDPGGGPSGGVRGFVRADGGAPVAGARVTINNTTVMAIADSSGRYAFGGLRSGLPIELNVSAAGYQNGTSEIVVPSGGHTEADFALDTAGRADPRPLDQSIVSSVGDGQSIVARPETASSLPSLTQNDVFRALQFLPSATGDLEASSELYVRGGTPDQTSITLDGFTIYPFTHAFGRFSALNMDAIERADFSGSAVDAASGGKLAGALRLVGASNASRTPDGVVDFSMLGWSARVSAPLGDRAAFLVAARATPPTTLYNAVLDETDGNAGLSARDRIAHFSGGSFALSPTSSFHDLNGKVTVKLTANDRASFTFYDARDAANQSRNVPQPLPSTGLAEPNPFAPLPVDGVAQVSDVETWNGRGVAVQWERQWSLTARTTLSIGHSEFSKDAAAASVLTSPSTQVDYSFGAGHGGSGGLAESNRISDTTVRVDNSLGIGFQHFVSVGGEIAALDTAYDAQTEVFQRSSASASFTSRLVDLLNQTGTGRVTTAYVQDAWRPLARLTISPGARLTHYDRAGSTYFDPRASGTYQLGHRVRLVGAWTIDHQMANRITREDRERGDGAFWVLSNGSNILVPRVQQAVAGAVLEMPDLVFDVRAYYKTLDDLTIFAPRLFPGISPAPGTSLLYYGSGKAKGIEFLLEHKAKLNTVWTSYTLGRAENTYPLLEPGAFPLSYDETHAFKAADTVRFGGSWSIGGVWLAGSGRPDTPALGATQVWFPSGASVYQVTFGPKNSNRLPPYHRLDVSAQRAFRFHWFNVALRGTVFNAYDRQNISHREYSTDDAQPVTSDVTLMRRTFDLSLGSRSNQAPVARAEARAVAITSRIVSRLVYPDHVVGRLRTVRRRMRARPRGHRGEVEARRVSQRRCADVLAQKSRTRPTRR